MISTPLPQQWLVGFRHAAAVAEVDEGLADTEQIRMGLRIAVEVGAHRSRHLVTGLAAQAGVEVVDVRVSEQICRNRCRDTRRDTGQVCGRAVGCVDGLGTRGRRHEQASHERGGNAGHRQCRPSRNRRSHWHGRAILPGCGTDIELRRSRSIAGPLPGTSPNSPGVPGSSSVFVAGQPCSGGVLEVGETSGVATIPAHGAAGRDPADFAIGPITWLAERNHRAAR